VGYVLLRIFHAALGRFLPWFLADPVSPTVHSSRV
jgi:hypothetical protein